MLLNNDLLIQCSVCDSTMVVNKRDIYPEIHSYERNMGAEIIYNFIDEVVCPNCGQYIFFRVSGYEYPMGAFNYDNYEINGGRFLIEPTVSIDYAFYVDDDVLNYEYPRVLENIDMILRNREYVYQLSSREFEEVVAEVFIADGYNVEITPPTRDGGKDIIAIKYVMGKPIIIFIECKRYDRSNKVSVEIVRGLFGVQQNEKANKSMVITTSSFTKPAIQFAESTCALVDLVNYDELYDMIVRHFR